MSSIIDNNIIPINNNAFSVGGTVSARLTLTPDYFTFTAESAGELTLNFDSPERFGWDEYILRIRDAFNTEIISAVIINDDKTISATLAKGGRYTISVEAASPQYPLPNADYSITASSFVKAKPTVSITAIDKAQLEGSPRKAGTKEYTDYKFKISLSEALTTSEKIYYAVSPESDSTNPNDFSVTTSFVGGNVFSFVEFTKGQTEKIVTVQVAKDLLEESNEEFSVRLSNPSSGIKLADHYNITEATAIISNDDRVSNASITNITADGVVEGTGTGLTTHRFEVTLDKPTLSEQTLDYAIVFGSNGTNQYDFSPKTPISHKVTFAKGASKATIDIGITQDSIKEGLESYMVRLSNPSAQIAIGTAEAQGLIVNDDTGSVLSWNAESQSAFAEGRKLSLTVKTDQAMTSNQTINWRIEGTTNLDGVTYNAASSADFKTISGSFSIAKGKSEATFSVDTLDDDLVEATELAKVVLTLPSSLTMNPNGYEKHIIINDNDTLPEITTTTKKINEGSSDRTTNFVINLATSKAVSYNQTLNWAVVAAGDAQIQEYDFGGNAFPSGTFTIAANSKNANIIIPIIADKAPEMSETFNLRITGQTTTILPIEITNDDGIVGTDKADKLADTIDDDFIVGRNGNDTITATLGGIDHINAGLGNDTITTGSQNFVQCMEGNDIVIVSSTVPNKEGDFNGGDGIDTLVLQNTHDFFNINDINGYAGNDKTNFTFSEFEKYVMSADLISVRGSAKNESFTYSGYWGYFHGGGGSDQFTFTDNTGLVFIYDFNLDDKIFIDGFSGKFQAVPSFTGKKGQILVGPWDSFTKIEFDRDGDGLSDLQIALSGVFTAADLLKVILPA